MSGHLQYADALRACAEPGSIWAGDVLERLDEDGWRALPPLLHLHGIAPLAHARLRESGRLELAPPDVRDRLETLHRRNAARNLLLFAELDRVLEACRSRNIPVIPLKGAYLARAVYADTSLRVMGDLDLQVRQEDGGAAADVLRGCGYVSEWRGDADWKRHSSHLPPFHHRSGYTVELHVDFKGRFSHLRIEPESIWRRARPDPACGPGGLAMAPKDLFLYLCLHLYRARLRVGLRHLVDLRELLRMRGLEFSGEELRGQAADWNMERMLWLAWTLLDKLFGGAPYLALPPAPGGYLLPPALWKAVCTRLFRREDAGSAMALFYGWLRMATSPWRRDDCRLSPPGFADGPGKTHWPDKLRHGTRAVAEMLVRTACHPLDQSRAFGRTIREERFDRWMKWP